MIKSIEKFKLKRYLQSRRYQQAINMLTPVAKNGDAQAAFQMGLIYSRAMTSIDDDDAFQAEKWLTKAAMSNHLQAQLMLGDLYALEAESQDKLVRSLKWYRHANQQGNIEAGRKLASLYLQHRHSISHDINATGLLLEAADKGDYKAQVLLAWCYKKGVLGLPSDVSRFQYWWNKLKTTKKKFNRSASILQIAFH